MAGQEIKTDVLVIGAGFAGLATAYFLAKDGSRKVTVIEQEKKLGGHASGRNAGMIRQSVSDPVLARLAREGRQALQKAERDGWGIGFVPCGSLLTAKAHKVKELERTRRTLDGQRVATAWWSAGKAAGRVSLLRGGDFRKGLYCPSDARVDIQKLLHALLKKLRRLGVSVRCVHGVEKIEKKPREFLLHAGGKVFYGEKIVNAAGAWAGKIAKKAGAVPMPLKAYRRHLFEAQFDKGHKGDSALFLKKGAVPFIRWPFVWDLSHQFYFRPLKRGLLLSPCDKARCGISAGEKIDRKIQKQLFVKFRRFGGRLRMLKVKKAKSGLRTMAPDGRFVIGEDPRISGFFWVAGLGGHGVTTCFSSGRLAADLVLGKKREKFLVDAVSPKRFLK